MNKYGVEQEMVSDGKGDGKDKDSSSHLHGIKKKS